MNNVIKPVGFVAALAVAGGLGYFIARETAPSAPPAPQAAVAPAAAEPEELKLEASYLDAVGIKTELVTAGNLSVDVLAPATVTAAPNGEGVVTAHATGTIIRLTKQLGDTVRVGETLALVESREAATMSSDRSVAETKAALARSALAREQELFQQRVTPRQDLERAQAELAVAETEVKRARDAAAASHITDDGRIAVVSPLSGRITSAKAALGSFVQSDTELFRIADPRFIQVEASVTAVDANRIAAGDVAKLTTASGSVIPATVRSVTATLNEETRAATVILSLAPNHEALSPGEVLQADITPKNAAPGGVVVPEEAVQNIGGRTAVFVRTPAGFRVQPVVVGSRGAGRVSILSGLNPGETIATANAFFLKAELNKDAGEEE
jgi:cobalt-zinc-cadmium efflux system membrane fusion protein